MDRCYKYITPQRDLTRKTLQQWCALTIISWGFLTHCLLPGHGAEMETTVPTTITSGYSVYASTATENIVIIAQVRPNITAMLFDARAAGNASAVLKFRNVVFTMSNALLVGDVGNSPWSSGDVSGIGLDLLIENCSTLPTSSIVSIFGIRGEFHFGSSIRIIGGTYWVADANWRLMGLRGVFDNASLVVTNTTFIARDQEVTSTSAWRLAWMDSAITFTRGATMLVAHNRFEASNLFSTQFSTGSGQWQLLFTVYSTLALKNCSHLRFEHNEVLFSNSVVGGAFTLGVLGWTTGSSALFTVDGGSSVRMSHNSIVFHTFRATKLNIRLWDITPPAAALVGGVAIANTSLVSFSGNSFLFNNCTLPGVNGLSLRLVSVTSTGQTGGGFSIRGMSTLEVVGTALSVVNPDVLRAPLFGKVNVALMETSQAPLTLDNATSRVSFVSNHIGNANSSTNSTNMQIVAMQLFARGATSNPSWLTIHLCRNTANGSACTSTQASSATTGSRGAGDPPCASGSDMTIVICTASASIASGTLSGSTATVSPLITAVTVSPHTSTTRSTDAESRSLDATVSPTVTVSTSSFPSPTHSLSFTTTIVTPTPTTHPATRTQPQSSSTSPSQNVFTPTVRPPCDVHHGSCSFFSDVATGPLSGAVTDTMLLGILRQSGFAVAANTTVARCPNNTSLASDNVDVPRVALPFSLWSNGAMYVAVSLRASMGASWVLPGEGRTFLNGSSSATFTKQTSSLLEYEVVGVGRADPPDAGPVWVVVKIAHVGFASRSMWTSTINVELRKEDFKCVIGDAGWTPPVNIGSSTTASSSVYVPIRLIFEEAPPIPAEVTVISDVSVVVAVTTVVPGALIRAGVLKSLIDMIRCSEFEPSDEVGFINNPLNWPVGNEVLQYVRGSMVITLLAGAAIIVVVAVAVAGMVMWGSDSSGVIVEGSGVRSLRGRVRAAFTVLRMPSSPLVAVILVSEVSLGPASTTLMFTFYGDVADSRTLDEKIADCVMAAVLAGTVLAYFAWFVWQVAPCSLRRHGISVAPLDSVAAARNSDTAEPFLPETPVAATEVTSRPNPSSLKRALAYLIEPTSEIVVAGSVVDEDGARESNETAAPQQVNERWLSRNYYFIADKRWPLFGPLEVAVGSVVINILDGIPLTTANHGLCVARPAVSLAVVLTLLVVLLVKRPNAVRLAQGSAIGITVCLTATCALILANAVAPSERIELVASYMGSVLGIISTLLGVFEMISLLLTYVPSLRTFLSLRVRGLQASLLASAERRKECAMKQKKNQQLEGHDTAASTPQPLLLYSSSLAPPHREHDSSSATSPAASNPRHNQKFHIDLDDGDVLATAAVRPLPIDEDDSYSIELHELPSSELTCDSEDNAAVAEILEEMDAFEREKRVSRRRSE